MRAVIALACAAGCYKPSLVNCQYSCAAGNACPAGFVCDQGNCVGSIGEACGPFPDSGGGGELIGEAGCAWSYLVSNVNPCQFAGITGDWLVLTNHTTMIDTTAQTITGDAPPAGSIHTARLASGTDAMVVYVGQFDLGRDATFVVTGQRPLIILADSRVSIDGVIDFSVSAGFCTMMNGRGSSGMLGVSVGGGGGGGSLGIVTIFSNGAGADGGNGGDAPSKGFAGVPLADTSLVPLTFGCEGGQGGNLGGNPGAAGGALQISTRGTLELLGELRANGGGGGSSPTTGGGGGGGSGGAILIEATTVTLQAGSTVCANGGGGGASNGTTTKAQNGQCSNAVAHGAGTSGNPGSGGDGESMSFDAIPGQAGSGAMGGGGGGGGVGIFRVNGTFDNQGATTSPNVTQ